MNSCFYEGTVTHHRFSPVEHRFCYRLFMTYLDLAELDGLLGRRGLWSMRWPAVMRFRRADYLDGSERPLEDAVRDLVETRTGRRPTGPIRLLTNLRVLGFGMNPVSFYYCFDRADRRVETLVAEVTNTPWRERHCYEVACDAAGGDAAGDRDAANCSDAAGSDEVGCDISGCDVAGWPVVAKALHVSPFLKMDMAYRWRIGEPGEELTLGIENLEGADRSNGVRPFAASLMMERRPMTAWQRLRLPIRYPLLPQRIALGIYRQALGLWWKGVPTVAHPGHAARQDRVIAGESLITAWKDEAVHESRGEKAEV